MDYGKPATWAKGTTNSIGAYSPSATADAPPTSTPIRDGVSNAEQSLSELHGAIERLERRLDTVLRPVPPSTLGSANPGTPVGPPCSHVMGRLHILNEGFNGAIQRLNELMDRVEV